MTDQPKPCPRCLEAFDAFVIRYEGIQPLRGGVLDALDYNGRPHCQDCNFAERMVRMRFVPKWEMARTAVSNHRQESMRLPDIPIGLGMEGARNSTQGEWEKHLAWLDLIVAERCDIAGEPGYMRMCRHCQVKTRHYVDTDACSVCVSRIMSLF